MSGPESIRINADLVKHILAGADIRYQIVDLLAVEEFDFDSSHMKTLSEQDARLLAHSPSLFIAIVVNSKFAFGMNRMYASYLELGSQMDNCDVFESMSEAQDWIRSRLANL